VGPQGPVGPAGVSGYEQISTSQEVQLTPGQFVTQTTQCSPGKKVLGGGAVLFNPTGISTIQTSGPLDDHSWHVGIGNTQMRTNNFTLRVTAVCATVQ
jgi:hypothetical protein